MEDWLREMSANEFVVYACVMRKTWGFGKFEDAIAISQIVEMSGLSRTPIDRALDSLEKRGLLKVSGSIKRPRVYEPLMPRRLTSGNTHTGATGTDGSTSSGVTVTPTGVYTIDKRQRSLRIVK